ncbi:hypothetical protein ACKLNO_04635 [Neisseriaceae bacterium B1]
MYYVSVAEYIRDVMERIWAADRFASLLIKLNLLVLFFSVAVLVAEFSWATLAWILMFLLIYYGLLIWLDLNNREGYFYWIGFLGGLLALIQLGSTIF